MLKASAVAKGRNGAKTQPEDVFFRSASEFRQFFDSQARKNVGLSGKAALARIRSGRAGDDLGWTELTLLSALLEES